MVRGPQVVSGHPPPPSPPKGLRGLAASRAGRGEGGPGVRNVTESPRANLNHLAELCINGQGSPSGVWAPPPPSPPKGLRGLVRREGFMGMGWKSKVEHHACSFLLCRLTSSSWRTRRWSCSLL
jgi:hypothetical protein